MTRDEALALLAKHTGFEGTGEYVGPEVEAIAARIRAGEPVEDDELEAAVTLLLEYVTEIQRTILGACHVQVGTTTGGKPKFRIGWFDVGVALGFPGGTAHMRALGLARRIGLVPAAVRRGSRSDKEDAE